MITLHFHLIPQYKYELFVIGHCEQTTREDGKLFFLLNYSYQCWPDGPLGTYALFYNIFCKNIEAEICEILRIILRIKPRLRFLKRIDIILCVESSVSTIQFSGVFFTRIKQPLLVNKEFIAVNTLDCP